MATVAHVRRRCGTFGIPHCTSLLVLPDSSLVISGPEDKTLNTLKTILVGRLGFFSTPIQVAIAPMPE